jgi:hypothetical protein
MPNQNAPYGADVCGSVSFNPPVVPLDFPAVIGGPLNGVLTYGLKATVSYGVPAVIGQYHVALSSDGVDINRADIDVHYIGPEGAPGIGGPGIFLFWNARESVLALDGVPTSTPASRRFAITFSTTSAGASPAVELQRVSITVRRKPPSQ